MKNASGPGDFNQFRTLLWNLLWDKNSIYLQLPWKPRRIVPCPASNGRALYACFEKNLFHYVMYWGSLVQHRDTQPSTRQSCHSWQSAWAHRAHTSLVAKLLAHWFWALPQTVRFHSSFFHHCTHARTHGCQVSTLVRSLSCLSTNEGAQPGRSIM